MLSFRPRCGAVSRMLIKFSTGSLTTASPGQESGFLPGTAADEGSWGDRHQPAEIRVLTMSVQPQSSVGPGGRESAENLSLSS